MSGKREIVFDTETTGFNATGDDRITEIGCVEIIDLLPTGKNFHAYINPRRSVPEKVTEITGLTEEFLREMFPGSPASLDALCKRFGVSLAGRNTHGAIIDSELLAEVYLQLNGGREHSLALDDSIQDRDMTKLIAVSRSRPDPLPSLLTPLEKEQHANFINGISEDMLWQKYWRKSERA